MQLRFIMKLSNLKFNEVKFPELWLNIDSSIISIAKSFLKKIATPLAWEVNEEKFVFPPHSALTVGYNSFAILVSENNIISACFFLRWCNILLRFGFLPIELGLKPNILNLEADWAADSKGLLLNIW